MTDNGIASLGYVRIGMSDPGEWASVGDLRGHVYSFPG